MKEVQMSGVFSSLQMTVGIKGDAVVLCMERDPRDNPHALHWLSYGAPPDVARDIAKMLVEGADLIEGKMADEGQYDHHGDAFREHNHGSS